MKMHELNESASELDYMAYRRWRRVISTQDRWLIPGFFISTRFALSYKPNSVYCTSSIAEFVAWEYTVNTRGIDLDDPWIYSKIDNDVIKELNRYFNQSFDDMYLDTKTTMFPLGGGGEPIHSVKFEKFFRSLMEPWCLWIAYPDHNRGRRIDFLKGNSGDYVPVEDLLAWKFEPPHGDANENQ